MPKRKKPSPLTCPIEAVIWNDAQFIPREKLDTSPCLMHTVGFLVHEDATQIILAHEVNSVEDWMEADMDHTKIPIGMVVKRTKVGEVSIMQEDSESGA